MNRQDLLSEIRNWPVEDRVSLVEDIWQSIEGEEQYLDLTPEQRKELKRRLEECKTNPPPAYSWDEFVAKIRASA